MLPAAWLIIGIVNCFAGLNDPRGLSLRDFFNGRARQSFLYEKALTGRDGQRACRGAGMELLLLKLKVMRFTYNWKIMKDKRRK
ncbi:hypothetical protein SAMN04488502_10358 [Dendrosporobacter quercicolus]|uniref:Uncharacterized protein n=1 Tax=Dendrosporobacter quercicolus TaxID=146817 RepID=A0A1G9RP78_9FIRM|nr:hypothetical protein SAMN04488502_10358 [Dendrosporobacter quercicolus]